MLFSVLLAIASRLISLRSALLSECQEAHNILGHLYNPSDRSGIRSSQDIEESKKMDLPPSPPPLPLPLPPPSPFICLDACGLCIVVLYLHSPMKLHPVEKSL